MPMNSLRIALANIRRGATRDDSVAIALDAIEKRRLGERQYRLLP
jgi:hypothetical protein